MKKATKEIEEKLTGGHPNSLENTIEVVEEVLAEPDKFDALFHCYFSKRMKSFGWEPPMP